MTARVSSAATLGIDALVVEVEAEVSRGLPKFFIVGLPDEAVQEARERVRAGIKHSGLSFPEGRITVNLAPADTRKEGPGLDLAIALAVLQASRQLRSLPPRALFVGELSLDGTLRPVRGVLSTAVCAAQQGFRYLVVPQQNAAEAALVRGMTILAARSLSEVVGWCAAPASLEAQPPTELPVPPERSGVDLIHIRGQEHAKRALAIAAAGGHNLLLSGPPGSGKTMLAKALPGLLPPLTFEEVLTVTRLYSVSGLLEPGMPCIVARPLRSPHHTASAASIVGGGRTPKPGEISLAHAGILFLDEFPEFPRQVIEALREPLEEGTIVVSRVAGSARFPADVLLVAAMNPCPCGYRTDGERQCTCSPQSIAKYQKRLSGPILDRIDLHLHIPRLPFARVVARSGADLDSRAVAAQVAAARERQRSRHAGKPYVLNRHIPGNELAALVPLDAPSRHLLERAMQTYQLSIRSYHRLLRVSRTIADLDGEERVAAAHVAEALQYRSEQIH